MKKIKVKNQRNSSKRVKLEGGIEKEEIRKTVLSKIEDLEFEMTNLKTFMKDENMANVKKEVKELLLLLGKYVKR